MEGVNKQIEEVKDYLTGLEEISKKASIDKHASNGRKFGILLGKDHSSENCNDGMIKAVLTEMHNQKSST
jgi:hypothetical protein